MKKVIILILLLTQFSLLSAQGTKVDTTNLSRIKNEAIQNSTAMDNLKTFCYLYGARLMWSPQYKKSADWLSSKLKEIGIPKVYLEDINHSGKSWALKKYYLNLVEPYTLAVIGNPKEWTPSTNGLIRSEVVYLNAKTEADLEKYKGQLTGKIVFVSDPTPLRPYTNPWVTRYSDDSLKSLSNVTIPDSIERIKAKEEDDKNNEAYIQYFTFLTRKVEFCKNEGAALLIDAGYRYYGLNQIWANTATTTPKDIYDYLSKYAGNPDIPESLPQITISMEQYNTILGILEKGGNAVMEAEIDVEKGGVEKGFSVIAEIPGTDLKDEVVMLGAHLDSYPFANGAADNGASVIACVEALKIFKTLGLQPRRTVRIGLWGGEEEEYLGSTYHIKKHFIEGKEKCYAYFNMDFGVGRFRGIYAEENQGAANLFKEWMKTIDDPKFQTVCLSVVKNSDQQAFHDAGLQGFQFIQDPLDYYKIYHTNVDFVDRIPKDDLVNDAFIMSAFAWLAANREGEFPIK
jgi:carboxypeptidase Q